MKNPSLNIFPNGASSSRQEVLDIITDSLIPISNDGISKIEGINGIINNVDELQIIIGGVHDNGVVQPKVKFTYLKGEW